MARKFPSPLRVIPDAPTRSRGLRGGSSSMGSPVVQSPSRGPACEQRIGRAGGRVATQRGRVRCYWAEPGLCCCRKECQGRPTPVLAASQRPLSLTTHTLCGERVLVTKTRAGAVRRCEPVVQAVVPPASEEWSSGNVRRTGRARVKWAHPSSGRALYLAYGVRTYIPPPT